MKIGDQIDHKSIGPCTVTHIWLRDIGVTPDDGCEGETIIIPRESAMEMTDDDQPRDANGEVLEVGGIAIDYLLDEVVAITGFSEAGCVRFDRLEHKGSGKEDCRAVEKLTTLTRDQYLPLARRTLDPGMTRRERLGMLTRGVCGEYGEYCSSPSAEEVGDLLWYATILADEMGKDGDDERWIEDNGLPITWLHMNGNRRDEYIKKAIYHDVGPEALEELAAEGLAVCHYAVRQAGQDIGEIRYRNIRKLIDRYPDGFVSGGGRR